LDSLIIAGSDVTIIFESELILLAAASSALAADFKNRSQLL